MKLTVAALCLILFTSSTLFGQSKKELRAELQRLNAELDSLKASQEVDLNNPDARASYAIGILMARNMTSEGIDTLDLVAMKAAFEDVFSEKELRMTYSQALEIFQQYTREAFEKKQQALEKEYAQKKEEGLLFLEENKNNEGVQETESGLQYKVLSAGSGRKPTRNQKVSVHYTGKLLDGTVFDSSKDRGMPLTLNVNGVIPGWTEALQLMQEGDKWRLWIPYSLAYGERGAGSQIPPFATLIFDVELLKVHD